MSSCSRAPQFRDRRGDVAGGAALKGVFQVEVSRAADQRRVVADVPEAPKLRTSDLVDNLGRRTRGNTKKPRLGAGFP